MATDLAAASSAVHDHTLRLRDGRSLGYAEYGDPNGKPWVFHHGLGDCRLLIATMSDAATKTGVRIIAPDRWGISLSDPRPNGSLLDWPDDIQELVDALGIREFVVGGGGGGAAFALACAYKIPERLKATAVGELVSPGLRTYVPRALAWLPPFVPSFVFAQGLKLRVRSLQRSPDRNWQRRLDHAHGDTRTFYEQDGMQAFWQGMQLQAYSRGTGGGAREFMLLARPWGFDLRAVRAQVYLWQAENDVAAARAARVVASELPSCHATFVPNADRLWMLANADEIFAAINAVT